MTIPLPSVTPPDGSNEYLPTFMQESSTVGVNVWTAQDYTSGAVANEYSANVQTIYNLYNQTSPYTVTSGDVTNIQNAVTNLITLANTGNAGNYMTQQMASSVNLLLVSFQAVGATDPTAINATQLQQWKDLSLTSSSIQNTMSAALGAVAANTSLQSMIELDYVTTGNNMINGQLTSLDNALNTTSSVLSSLTNIQNIMNDVTVNSVAPFSAGEAIGYVPPGSPAGTAALSYQSAYAILASAHFNQPVGIHVNSVLMTYGANGLPTGLTTAGLSVFNSLLALRNSLIAFLPGLSAAVGSAVTDPNSLYGTVKKLITDFSQTFGISTIITGTTYGIQPIGQVTSPTGAQEAQALYRYIVDNNTKTFNTPGRVAGTNQQDLTTAITAAQGLNDTQKENVQQYLFIFQEFYKSASAMLQSITQIITDMAKHISQ